MGACFWFITCTGILNQHFRVESNPVNTDIEGTIESIESICINGVSVLKRVEKYNDLLSPGTKQTVHNFEMPVLSRCQEPIIMGSWQVSIKRAWNVYNTGIHHTQGMNTIN